MAQAIREDGKEEMERQAALGIIGVLEEEEWSADEIVAFLMESLKVSRQKADEYMRESAQEKNSPS